jgi:predicted GNAT superfamily acetyltransferase
MMGASSETSIVIRDIGTAEEMREVEQLQKEIWGVPDLDVVPAAQLVASKAAGGFLLGAFQGDRMAGFVYGFVGYENGKAIHHSHMLAIRPEFRNFNLGRKLKMAQRESVLNQGIDEMTWTFDPLQSQNAYINFNKLGVVSKRYLINFYGEDATSFLHRNGTDRLWVTWLLNRKRVVDRKEAAFSGSFPEDAKHLIAIGKDGSPKTHGLEDCLLNEKVLIEIPGDINSLEKEDRELAFEWRFATRNGFTKAIEAGFLVEEFYRTRNSDNPSGTYVLSRGKGFADIL